MLDRMQRLRRGAVIGRRRLRRSAVLASCGGTGTNNGQNSLRPGGTRRPARSSTCSHPFFWVAVVVGVGVVGMTIFVAVRFRERPGERRSPVQIHGNTVLEISWTIIPFLILAVMAVPTVADDLRPREEAERRRRRPRSRRRAGSGSGSTSTPTRHEFFTANEMHIPIGRPIVHARSLRHATVSSTRSGCPSSPARRTSCPATRTRSRSRPTSPARTSASAPSTAACRTPTCACGSSPQTEADYDAWVASQQQKLDATDQVRADRLGDATAEQRRGGAASAVTRSSPSVDDRDRART